jgi:Mrp family chromosome partitioning ATPase
VDAYGVAVVSAVAGVAGAAATIWLVLLPFLQRRRARSTGPSGRLLPAPVLDLTVRGRDGMVEDLAGRAFADGSSVRVLTGLAGVGKSTVARAVAGRVTAMNGRAWWVPADNEESVTRLLLGLAEELGAPSERVRAARSSPLAWCTG